MARGGADGHFPIIPFPYSDHVLSTTQVERGEYFGFSQLFQGRWYQWQRITILGCDLSHTSVIYAQAYATPVIGTMWWKPTGLGFAEAYDIRGEFLHGLEFQGSLWRLMLWLWRGC